jgi:intraflagellar transport protein 80
MQVGKKKLKWKAHDGVVMECDWNSVNNLIVSAGEDCVYKVWDSFGRQLYQSQPFEYVITSVAWSPNGEQFSVGSFNMLRLCDKTGWSYCRDRPNSGSLMQIAWTSDGTLMAGAGGNGAVVFGQLIERSLTWNNVEVVLIEPNKVRVQDVFNETMEELDFRDRVLEMSLGFGYLILATATQCYIYNVNNWNTPHIFDMRNPVNVVIQSRTHFVTIDNIGGVQVYNYEGRAKGNPRAPGMRPEFLNHKTVSLSSDTIAVLDKSDGKKILLFDVETGRPLAINVTHSIEIVELAISQFQKGADRGLMFIDRNRDMYVSPIGKFTPYKLHTQVDSAAWNDDSDMLMCLSDAKVFSWYFPMGIFVDKELLQIGSDVQDGTEYGKIPEIINFFGTRAQVRRADGAVLIASVSPYPAMLYEFVFSGQSKWEEAVRLCRFVKQPSLWACLAMMALHGRHLETAEIALAAIDEVDKLHFVLYIQSIPSEEGRNAELALYRGAVDDAEMILLQAQPPLVYRAVKMNICLFRWERALDLAISNQTHVDTVLGYRQKYLDSFGKTETDKRFKEYFNEVPIDWETINEKEAQEIENESARSGGGGGSHK